LRRVVINLACKLGISYREVEAWDMETLREHYVMLTEMNTPKDPPPDSGKRSGSMTEAEIEASLRERLDKQPLG
jgi:hypothetical protein